MERMHYIYVIGMIIIAIISVYVLVDLPHGAPFPPLEGTPQPYVLFGLGLTSTTLIWTIGIYLLQRWIKTKRRNPSLIIWSISFFIYSITFVAHIFRALGFEDANENTSTLHFFTYRWGMIVWAAGILYGLAKILTENKKLRTIPSISFLILGFTMFFLGLFIVPSENPIETTMYYFLYIIWIPVCFTMTYTFYYYGNKVKQVGPKIISLGFFGLLVTYMAWAPWHFADVVYLYFVWYFIFSLSLNPILYGFIIMAVEEKQK